MSGFGSVGSMETVRKDNLRLRSSVKKYRKLKNNYIGVGNEHPKAQEIPALTPEQVKEGRARAKAYLKRRNTFNWILTVLIIIVIASPILYYVYRLLS